MYVGIYFRCNAVADRRLGCRSVCEEKGCVVYLTTSGQQQARGQCQHRATSLVLSASFIPPDSCCCPKHRLLVWKVGVLKWIMNEREGMDFTKSHSVKICTAKKSLGNQKYHFWQYIECFCLIFWVIFCLEMNIEITSSLRFPAVYCGGRTKQSSKQTKHDGGRGFYNPSYTQSRDANEISHGLAVEEIELPCLLLDWRNALLMLWGEELNGGGGCQRVYPPQTLPESGWALCQVDGPQFSL